MRSFRKRAGANLWERRDRAARKAPNLAEVLRGTLRRRYIRCGKAGCHCAKGPGHGPFIYLSVTLGVGRTEQVTIAPEHAKLARRYVANYGRAYQVLEDVSAVNRELLRRRLLSERASAGRSQHPGAGRRRG